MTAFTRIGLVLKRDMDHGDEALHVILNLLRKRGAELFADETSLSLLPNEKDIQPLDVSSIDLLLVIGGDGTILRAVRDVAPRCPILSVNRGLLGFLTEMSLTEAPKLLDSFLDGEGILEERCLLTVEALRGKEVIFSGEVLNEAVIAQGSIARLIDLRAEVNDEELAVFRSDGLIAATPTGSTAYSLAAGGPVVHPRMPAIILTPINPQSFNQKPIVLPGDSNVDIEVMAKLRSHEDAEVTLTLDGQRFVKLKQGDTVRIKTSARTVKFLRRKKETFLQILRTKLKWAERVA